ncbi:uncharacterized protein LOC107361601 [Tetranychus urticae]|uniref:Dynamin N-terminal domain-containing protein n=1 Tax=Tetranychus urticae TaxID=32264 RepID=T1K970_TETUR|nr:uncharacterized protein LOC107361601 [Tetranychus urticae]
MVNGDKQSGKVINESTSSSASSSNTPANANILKECHSLYVEGDYGLIKTGRLLGLSLLAPRRKIMVMLIGNHSAGKSSFINWYVGDRIQKTGVAIETQGFTFITNGKKRESLTGKATLHLHPHFKALENIKGLSDYLSTEISPSLANRFNCVTFIDTPGLVDGDMYYPYDVDKAIQWLGGIADLIFVFFDPIGQALCRRTLDVVQKLNAVNTEKIKLYLSKADEAGEESDRQKVMMQIVQELCKRPGLNKTGFQMATIYIPDSRIMRPTNCINQIDDIHEQIEKTINYTVQHSLNTLEKDCDRIINLIDKKIADDDEKKSKNLHARIKSSAFLLISLFLPFLIILREGKSLTLFSSIKQLTGESVVLLLENILQPIGDLWKTLPHEYHFYVHIGIILTSLIFLGMGLYTAKFVPSLDRKTRNDLIKRKEYILSRIKPRRYTLYKEYLAQSVNDEDLLG